MCDMLPEWYTCVNVLGRRDGMGLLVRVIMLFGWRGRPSVGVTCTECTHV